MGDHLAVDPPTNVIQSLVHSLLDVFDAARDLVHTLHNKSRRDLETSLRSNGYPASRKIEYVDEGAGEESIVLHRAAVKKQFDVGFYDVGAQFAVGDVISQTGLQCQIIELQSIIINTFLYGPTSPDPISHQLSAIVKACRQASSAAIDILRAQRDRQLSVRPPSAWAVVPAHSLTTGSSASTTSTALTPYPTKPTLLPLRPKSHRSDTETTSLSTAPSTPQPLYCPYALDLQTRPSLPLSSTFFPEDGEPYCPACRRILKLEPGHSWEIYKTSPNGKGERCFRVSNRFLVKCHRGGVDGGYSCVLCSKGNGVETVCGDVRALVRHVWLDHEVRELEGEGDVVEVEVESEKGRRRDSVLGVEEVGRKGAGSVGRRRRRSVW
ncbi:hypothetical protein M011DRAFT_480588 [Sporormia fimetaria CBS 119925]|uniref:Uncharacterized protein n=1 Tax=Sporormia fimetaria CBS 119925 TaxID=1340428 RepID=A0A6A6V1G0_9PLEO|nr:hypothetical protein M011DRAFT_480588 [Sporormia fimetaria CBS 119925]